MFTHLTLFQRSTSSCWSKSEIPNARCTPGVDWPSLLNFHCIELSNLKFPPIQSFSSLINSVEFLITTSLLHSRSTASLSQASIEIVSVINVVIVTTYFRKFRRTAGFNNHSLQYFASLSCTHYVISNPSVTAIEIGLIPILDFFLSISQARLINLILNNYFILYIAKPAGRNLVHFAHPLCKSLSKTGLVTLL